MPCLPQFEACVLRYSDCELCTRRRIGNMGSPVTICTWWSELAGSQNTYSQFKHITLCFKTCWWFNFKSELEITKRSRNTSQTSQSASLEACQKFRRPCVSRAAQCQQHRNTCLHSKFKPKLWEEFAGSSTASLCLRSYNEKCRNDVLCFCYNFMALSVSGPPARVF